MAPLAPLWKRMLFGTTERADGGRTGRALREPERQATLAHSADPDVHGGSL